MQPLTSVKLSTNGKLQEVFFSAPNSEISKITKLGWIQNSAFDLKTYMDCLLQNGFKKMPTKVSSAMLWDVFFLIPKHQTKLGLFYGFYGSQSPAVKKTSVWKCETSMVWPHPFLGSSYLGTGHLNESNSQIVFWVLPVHKKKMYVYYICIYM